MRLSVIIPAHNEEANIKDVIDRMCVQKTGQIDVYEVQAEKCKVKGRIGILQHISCILLDNTTFMMYI